MRSSAPENPELPPLGTGFSPVLAIVECPPTVAVLGVCGLFLYGTFGFSDWLTFQLSPPKLQLSPPPTQLPIVINMCGQVDFRQVTFSFKCAPFPFQDSPCVSPG